MDNMTEEEDLVGCSCQPGPPETGKCNVEAVVSVDNRGQMVLPKDVRKRAEIAPGDKLALVSWERDGGICCMSLIKVDELSKLVKETLGPMMKEVM
jgi:AbrB family looped-hinge helix DNA binding protein